MAKELSGYDLSRSWFNFCFENPDKITPTHTAIYFFAIEHCNRLGWKQKFGLPTTMAMEAVGVRSYKTYIKTLKDLVDFGFIKMIETSKNQYSSNIVALVNFTEALTKALDKAMIKHAPKHLPKQVQSIDSIDKQVTIEPITSKQESNTPAADLKNSNLFRQPVIPTKEDVYRAFLSSGGTKEMADVFYDKNDATNWFLRGSPIINFRNLLPSFISNWTKNEKNAKSTGAKQDATEKFNTRLNHANRYG